MGKSIISIGSKYYKLTVLECVGKDKYGNKLFRCLCDCGNETVVKGTSLTMNVRPTKSCSSACSKKLAPGMAVANMLHSRYLTRDKKKSRKSDMPMEIFLRLTQSNCHYCGVPPSQQWSVPQLNGTYVYNGLDRTDNDLGYTIENSVPCCRICNTMKNDMGKQQFLNHINNIFNNLKL